MKLQSTTWQLETLETLKKLISLYMDGLTDLIHLSDKKKKKTVL